jgi:hypothetical protein
MWRRNPEVPPEQSGAGAGWLLLSLLACLLFALPLLLVAYFQADYLSWASESLAYCYFACERLAQGEGGTVWLPHGHVLGVVQHLILLLLNHTLPGGAQGFQQRVNLFAAGSTLANVLAMSVIFLWAGRSRILRPSDKLLIFFAGLAPLYTTGRLGFVFSLLPAYYHVDMVLVPLAVAVFLWQLRAAPPSRPWLRAAALGALVGLFLSNKVTLAVVGVMALAPSLLAAPCNARRLLGRALLAGACALLAFGTTLWAFYQFRLSALVEMFPRWAGFVGNPGGEADFWTEHFWVSLRIYQFRYHIGFWGLAASTFLVLALRRRGRRWVWCAMGLLNVACGAACAFFLVKRPANTTFFEVAVLLTGLAAMAVGALDWGRVRHSLLLVATLGSLALSVLTFPWTANVALVELSRSRTAELWGLHHDLLRIAAGRKIIVIHPNDSYSFGGIHEVCLKGAADCPTWHISERGQRIMNELAPGMEIRHEYEGTKPDAPFPPNSVIVWFEHRDWVPVTQRYPSLVKLYAEAGADKWEWELQLGTGETAVRARACLAR